MTVTLSLFAGAGAQFLDNSGNVLTGGKIYTYAAGTTTPAETYTDISGVTPHPNPIILDASGRVPGGEIWLRLGVGYKFILKTSTEVLIATYDNIPSSAQPPAANDADSIMYEQGYTVNAGSFVIGKTYRIVSVGSTNFVAIGASANTVGLHFIATGVGSGSGTAELSQTVETKLRQTVSVKDFGAVGDGITNDTVAIQAAIDSLSPNGGVVNFPAGEYRIARNIGVNDRWGVKITSSNITLKGDQAYLRRFDTDISTYALAYPILFVGTPDSNVAAASTNIIIDELNFIGENTRHSSTGSSLSDFRYAIEFKNSSDTWVKNCIFSAIDSSAMDYQRPVTYDYANNQYYNTTKNYRSKITGCSFIAEPHAVVRRALLHAIPVSGVDFCLIDNNYFEWCDDCVSGETTYNRYQDTENDTFTYPSPPGALALGPVKRSGRNITISNNVCYNSSEHALYPALMDVTITGNNIRTDEPTICTGDMIKIRSRGVTCTGNIISNYANGISVNEAAQDVTISGNTIRCCSSTETGGKIDINSENLSSYISNRPAFYIGGSPDYQPMRNIAVVGNTLIIPDAAAAATNQDVAIRIYTAITDANYPEGQIQGITISNNTIKGYNVGIYTVNNLFRNCVVNGNSFYAKNFVTAGFTTGTTLNTRAVVQALQSSAGATLTSMSPLTFSDNYVFGATYLFATNTAAGGANTYYIPESIVGNRLNYIKNIKTADVRLPSFENRFTNNTGTFFLDRTWGGATLENTLFDGTNSDSLRRYCTQWTGSQYRFYTDDAGTFVTL